MAILETLKAEDIDLALFIDADMIRVGEAYARLFGFVQGEDKIDGFTCDAGTYAAVRRAAARITNQPKDKSTTVRYVQRAKNGKNVWKRMRKDEEPKTNDKTREAIVWSHSSDAVRAGIETLRESFGVAIKRQAQNVEEGINVVALVRSKDEQTA